MAIVPKQKQILSVPLTPEMLEKAKMGLAEGSGYTGAGDCLIEFKQASSFLNETDSARVYTVTISNASANDKLIDIFGGQIQSLLTGYTALVDGTIDTNITGSARPSSVAAFNAYVNANPTRLRKIQLKVDNVAQNSEAFLYRVYDPFKNQYDEDERIPQNYQSTNDYNAQIIEIADLAGWEFQPMSALLYKVQAGRTVTITMVCGASFDAARALNRKADEAAMNVARVIANK